MDLYSRRIIGWAFAHHLGTELVAAALAMGLVHRRPPEGLIHHSDRGVQYASAAYRQVLKAHGVVASMSRKGCCYDNAAMEAFFSTLGSRVRLPQLFCDPSKRSARNLVLYGKLLQPSAAAQCALVIWPRRSSKTWQTNLVTTYQQAALESTFPTEK